MLVDDKSRITELLPYLPLRLARAVTWLRDTDLDALPDGRQEIDGDNIYAVIMSYDTGRREEQIAEAHFKYIDVQYIIKGQEALWRAPLDGGTVSEQNLKDDYVFFAEVKGARRYAQTEGNITVFFPWDIHQARCQVSGRPQKVRKAVVKVLADGEMAKKVCFFPENRL